MSKLRPLHLEESDKNTSFSKWMNKNTYLVIGIVIILCILLLVIVNHKSGNKTGQQQIDNTVSQVGKLFLLPSGEQPTLAVINDASKYSSVPFLRNAQNGDKLLVYAQAREAILYRPSINKIIAVAPLNPDINPSK